jgi:hypothetical protein
MWSNYPIVPHNCDFERPIFGYLKRAPRERDESRFGKPRLGVDNCFHEKLDSFKAGAQWANNTSDGVGSGHCRAPSICGNSKSGRFKTI